MLIRVTPHSPSGDLTAGEAQNHPHEERPAHIDELVGDGEMGEASRAASPSRYAAGRSGRRAAIPTAAVGTQRRRICSAECNRRPPSVWGAFVLEQAITADVGLVQGLTYRQGGV